MNTELREAEAHEATPDPSPARVLDLAKPYLWRILKLDPKAGEVFVGPVWVEVGSIPHKSEWSEPSAQDIGEQHGPGEFLLIHNERVRPVEIVQTATYQTVKQDPS